MKIQSRTALLLIFLFICSGIVRAAGTLETPSFTIEIALQCEEGVVGCDKVSYKGTSKKTGKTIELSGKQLMKMCSDGVTPCHSLGYQFKSGNTVYFVSDDGRLTVTQGKKVIVNEQGKWKDDAS